MDSQTRVIPHYTDSYRDMRRSRPIVSRHASVVSSTLSVFCLDMISRVSLLPRVFVPINLSVTAGDFLTYRGTKQTKKIMKDAYGKGKIILLIRNL